MSPWYSCTSTPQSTRLSQDETCWLRATCMPMIFLSFTSLWWSSSYLKVFVLDHLHCHCCRGTYDSRTSFLCILYWQTSLQLIEHCWHETKVHREELSHWQSICMWHQLHYLLILHCRDQISMVTSWFDFKHHNIIFLLTYLFSEKFVEDCFLLSLDLNTIQRWCR